MELKNYQKKVISDLTRFLELLNCHLNIEKAFSIFWLEKNVPVGFGGVPAYQYIIPKIPHICFKVPTGGGKTFIACNSIKPIFDSLSFEKSKVVVWLVPSDAILEQAIKSLADSEHPYRQKLNIDFNGRVEIYTKQMLLFGQNFNPTTVNEQLSILVLSYDSFRSNKKDGRKAYQENSNLVPFSRAFGVPENVVEGADETGLIQIINQLTPLVIVDESHHARSDLSLEMLRNFNPCFVLDLTATPKAESNIISYIDAAQLKRENMVKLPVIVYNRDNQSEVIVDAIDLRRKLEDQAIQEFEKTGEYIRPIVLFQAQPKGNEDRTTFQKLRERMSEAGIPANEIAIKTATINELKNVDLLSKKCKIRYIITINALKEGWDCPFAYVLATLANKTSTVDVEQILGRVLRQPYAKKHDIKALNLSYVLTSSNDFKDTLNHIVIGLNNAGFSSQDCRIVLNDNKKSEPVVLIPDHDDSEEFLNFDKDQLSSMLAERQVIPDEDNALNSIEKMLYEAEEQGAIYEQAINNTSESQLLGNAPLEVREKMNVFFMNSDFVEEMASIKMPQFYLDVPDSLFVDDSSIPLKQTHLADGFTLNGKPYNINFDNEDDNIFQVDVDSGAPKYSKISGHDSVYFKEYFSKLPEESRIKQCKEIIVRRLDKMDMVDSSELRDYIDKIVSSFNKDQLSVLEKSVFGFADKIKKQIDEMLNEYYRDQFMLKVEQGKITCRPSYMFPEYISPLSSVSNIAKSLYSAEEDMNEFEYKLVTSVASLSNIKWWHRNISRHGFNLNGFVNHYPDIIVLTTKGRIVVIETKGDHLENTETKLKLELGRAWQHHTEDRFRYYMVFQSKDLKIDGSYYFDSFMEVIKEL